MLNTFIKVTQFGAGAAMLCAGMAIGFAVTAHASAANVGTLKCILDPGTKEPFGVERQLTCSFSPIIGPKADFVGVVRKLGVETPSQGTIVLIWSVVGPSEGFTADLLQGRYVGNLTAGSNAAGAPGLIGGLNADIALQPLNADPRGEINAAPSILELDLSAMKA